jgi:hypothetical protein
MVFAALVLLASLLLVFGQRSAPEGETRDPVGGDPGGLHAEADALSRRLAEGDAGVRVPEGLSFHRAPAAVPDDPPAAEAPGIATLSGSREGFGIVLAWEPVDGDAAGGYLVERLGPGGEVLGADRLGPEDREWRDGPVDTLFGARRYRVSALDREGEVSTGPQKVARVAYRIDFDLRYAGPAPNGAAEIVVELRGLPAEAVRRFAVLPGASIGARLSAGGQVPELDWTTGWVFRGIRGARLVEKRRSPSPRFAENGDVQRDAENGELLVEEREVRVSRIVEEAGVSSAETPEVIRWLRMSDD